DSQQPLGLLFQNGGRDRGLGKGVQLAHTFPDGCGREEELTSLERRAAELPNYENQKAQEKERSANPIQNKVAGPLLVLLLPTLVQSHVFNARLRAIKLTYSYQVSVGQTHIRYVGLYTTGCKTELLNTALGRRLCTLPTNSCRRWR